MVPGPEAAPGTLELPWNDPGNERHASAEIGTTGLLMASSAELGSAHLLRLNAFGEYFATTNFPVPGALDTHSAGLFSLAYVPFSFLELFATYAASANTNSTSAPPLIIALGDLTLGAKASYDFGQGLTAGADLRLQSFAGLGNQDVRNDALGFSPRLVATYDLQTLDRRLPVRLHGNLGFLLDGTGRLASSLNAAQYYSLEINRYQRLLAVAAAEIPLPIATPFLEYQLQVPLGGGTRLESPAGTSVPLGRILPQAMDVGAKVTALRGVTVTAALSFSLQRQVALGVNPAPPWNLTFGVTYAVDPFLQNETRYVETVRAPPPQTGKVGGVVLDSATHAPIAGAILDFAGSGLPPIASEAGTGRFLSQELPARHVVVRIQREGYQPARLPLQLDAGQTATLTATLTALEKPAVVALWATAHGKPVPALVRLHGPQDEDVPLPGDAAAPHPLELKPGKYRVDCLPTGYLAQTRMVEASSKAQTSVTFALSPQPKRKLVQVTPKKLQLLQPLRFVPGKDVLAKESAAVLAQVVDVIVRQGIERVRVEGHIDDRGNKAMNQKLSLNRAQAVAKALSAAGIDPSRLEVVGYGATRPVAPDLTERGRELNRRIEFDILAP